MTNSKRQAKRIIRALTPTEKKRLMAAREKAETNKSEIMSQARLAKAAWIVTQREVGQMMASLREKRQCLGWSLADLETRTGIRRSVLSRLENDPNCNPTIHTLQRLATALGVSLQCTIADR